MSDLKTVFTIKPFSSEGNESSGYVIHFEGDYRSLFQLINHSLKQINPEFVNVEMRLNDGYSQSENISIARNKGFQEAPTLGIYSVDNIGIILLPGGTAVVQARTKSLPISKLNVLLTAIDMVAKRKRSMIYLQVMG
ncbi:hypothetical protein ACQKMD_19960 [Viridibacillus sp. NPDC096237]|uniref:hypothetical protein n=1 Tax=Viridibacillus sp. NPDC096237 TaxID=3390721 RepID=UPI003CFE81A6